MKRIFSAILVLIILLTGSVGAFAVVEPTKEFYVADYANVLTPETEQLIIDYNGALETQCQGAQFVVVTVDYLDGMYSDEYAMQVFNEEKVDETIDRAMRRCTERAEEMARDFS